MPNPFEPPTQASPHTPTPQPQHHNPPDSPQQPPPPPPHEPVNPSSHTTTPLLTHYPEFLTPSSFNPIDWPTWTSIERGMKDPIADTYPITTITITNGTTNAITITNGTTNANGNAITNGTTTTTTNATIQPDPSQQPHPSHPPSASNRRSPTTSTEGAKAVRKRRASKPTEGAEHARLWEGENFGVSAVVEALRGKVEVGLVVARLVQWRRVNQSVGVRREGAGG